MRAVLLFTLVAALCLSVVSGAQPAYKSCAASDADVAITNLTANEWPPTKGQELVLNVTGNNSKAVKSGEYSIAIKVGAIPLPGITGNIDAFHPLPWPVGALGFSYTQSIPQAAPNGNYNLRISAEDQDKHEIFCLTLAFHLGSAAEGEEGEGAMNLTNRGVSKTLHTATQQLKESTLQLKQSIQHGVNLAKTKLQAVPRLPKMTHKMERR